MSTPRNAKVSRQVPAVARLVDPFRERAGRVAADAHVLAHCQVAHEPEVLVDERQSLQVKLVAVHGRADLLAVEQHLAAGVGLVHSAHQFDERRLARAVLADEAVDLAGSHREVGVGQHRDTRESLRQPRHLEPSDALVTRGVGGWRREAVIGVLPASEVGEVCLGSGRCTLVSLT